MKDWYQRYYTAIQYSEAYSEFCRRVFGRSLGQHGFADITQVNQLADALQIRSSERLLDIGCGSGGITAHIAERSRADSTGIDYDDIAIAVAQRRESGPKVHFAVADIGALCFAAHSFDVVVAIDSLYFTPIDETVASIARILTIDGRMGALYSHGANPQDPLAGFDRTTLAPERTPLGVALKSQELFYTVHDLTEADRRHALVKKAVLEELENDFIIEGNEFLYQNRYGEALGVLAAIDAGAHARYLYIATKSGDKP